MTQLYHLDLFSLGVTTTVMAIFGFVIFLNDRKSATNRVFFLFSLITISYTVANYLNYQLSDANQVLWLLRIVLFTSVWHAFTLFHLFYIFPHREIHLPRWYVTVLVPLVMVSSLITLTPLTFTRITEPVMVGQVTNPEQGLGMAVFGLTVLLLIIAGITLLIQRILQAGKNQKRPYFMVLVGTTITFLLIIIFNFFLPVFFDILQFIPLAPVWFIPLILCTGYAIIKHQLLHVKVITTEIFTSLLAVATLAQVIGAENFRILLVRIIVFVAVLIFSVSLTQSVHREVEQRRILEELTKKLRAVNKQLRELDRVKSEFLSFASHQVKTPMTIVKGYASMISDGSFGAISTQVKEISDAIVKSADVMIALVNNLLDYRRMEEGKMDFQFETTRLVEFVAQGVEQIRSLAVEKKLQLDFHSAVVDVFCKIDKQKFQQVIQNLLDNAIKYTPTGKVSVDIVSGSDTDKTVIISVSDTGYGITPDLLPHLFEQFRRGSGETKKIRGTGLGLYIAKQIVEAHKGTMVAISDGEGKGSRFEVTLPIVVSESIMKS